MGFTGSEETFVGRDPHDLVVRWSGSTTSEAVTIEAASSDLRLMLPKGFAGSTISVLEQTPEGDFVPVYANGALLECLVLAATAGVNVLVDLSELAGAVVVKFVSDQTETCAGYLRSCA